MWFLLPPPGVHMSGGLLDVTGVAKADRLRASVDVLAVVGASGRNSLAAITWCASVDVPVPLARRASIGDSA